VAGLSGTSLLGFAVVEHESPRGDALPILIAIFALAGAYWVLTSHWMASRFPALEHLPGATQGDDMGDQNDASVDSGDNSLSQRAIHSGTGDINQSTHIGDVHHHENADVPVATATQLDANQPFQGSLVTAFGIEVSNAGVAHSLYVKAEAPTVHGLIIRPSAGVRGHSRTDPDPTEPGVVFTTINSPVQASYHAFVRHSSPEATIRLDCVPNGAHATPPLPEDALQEVWGS
jgi:hypothetical protein